MNYNISPGSPHLIESDAFPIEFLSEIAERESWRKEIYRPVYHIHKWWAKRLGSIFRGILLGSLLPDNVNLEKVFYQKHNFPKVAVFDPFMGSGTTIGEVHKLGGAAFGRDINPVACESVRIALGPLDRFKLKNAFSSLSATVEKKIRKLYRVKDEKGNTCDVLYFFWVKYIPCPKCSTDVDLFSTRIIARNAYPDRKPEIRICCPHCGDIFTGLNNDKYTICPSCGLKFDPNSGTANGTRATCAACNHTFSIAGTIRISGKPPAHRLYAKLILTPDGEKRYLAADSQDILLYKECSGLLQQELEKGNIRLPQISLLDGFNTRQALNYNYFTWRDFFNDRQLLALGWLHEAINEISDVHAREAFLALFSGLLEFNNMFTSYKGEGTGAVRHMFSHHILKPERTPIEANVWGTSKSSGSFLNLYKTRLLRALDYRAAPFEAKLEGTGKSFLSSAPFTGEVETSWPEQGAFKTRGIYITCGSSDSTGLLNGSMDIIVTDPPFFDNVHYSELADFFYAWQILYPRGFIKEGSTTRNLLEVQDSDAGNFSKKLRAVFVECNRVLKDDGILVFSYHHSRAEGWAALVEAIFDADFSVVNTHPVKAEMSVAAPKSQAKEPILLDVIMVCKKKQNDTRAPLETITGFDEVINRAIGKLRRLSSVGIKLSKNDRRITLISQFISTIGPVASAAQATQLLQSFQEELENIVERFSPWQTIPETTKIAAKSIYPQQRSFAFDITPMK
jgi:putative DNA methylase